MKCPNCGNEIFDTELLDTEYYNGCYYDAIEGTCPACGKVYRWTEKFTFSCVEDVEEVTDE